MKQTFEKLFGIAQNQITPLCVLTPFLTKDIIRHFHLSERYRGNPYTTLPQRHLTVIETRIGPLFTGDCVLSLKDSPCKMILFIGSCGSLNGQRLPIGSIVAPVICYPAESFSDVIAGYIPLNHPIPSPSDPLTLFHNTNIQPVHCASIGSIVCESALADKFRQKNIDVLDMECSSIFSAAQSIGIHAAALLYITDIIGQTSPYNIPDDSDRKAIQTAQTEIITTITQFSEIFSSSFTTRRADDPV